MTTSQGRYCASSVRNHHTVSADDEASTITVDGKTITDLQRGRC